MSSRRVEAVVFDFGGVLITSIHHQLGAVARTHGVDLPTMKSVLMGPTHSDGHPWQRAERGELAVADIQASLGPWASDVGVSLRGDEIESVLQPGQYRVVGSMIERLAHLRESGYRTGLLTNTFREFRPTMARDIDLDAFDVVIESFAVGSRKPEPAIYEATEDALGGVGGASIVYLDDFEENLAVPRSRDWHTIHVTDHDVALAELDAHLAV